ncbi:MAG TPA: cytochrome c [Labilithrix sp.]|nr:cytochrome c [Labilithrix sp.]
MLTNTLSSVFSLHCSGRHLSGVVALAGVLGAVSGCRGQTSHDTPIFGIRNMYDQPRYDMQEESAFFPDRRTMRPLVDGVVSYDQDVDPQIAQGRLDDESGYVLEIPKAVIARNNGMAAMVERGKERYGIYCAPCHDGTGSGEGLVKRRAVASGAAAFVPPTFHQDRIRHMPDGQLFATITNGKSNMPPYAMQIKVDDRWSIVAYVRALQLAQPKLEVPALAPTAAPGGTSAPAPGGTAAQAADEKSPETGTGAAPTGDASTTAPADAAHEEKKP